MTSSLTTALEEIEQLKGENDALKTDNTQLKTNNDAMKDKIDQLKFEVDMIKAKNAQLKIENGNLKGDHVNTSTSLHPPPVPPRRHKLKVSRWSRIIYKLFTYIVAIVKCFFLVTIFAPYF